MEIEKKEKTVDIAAILSANYEFLRYPSSEMRQMFAKSKY